MGTKVGPRRLLAALHPITRPLAELRASAEHHGTTPNEFCADKWVSPAPEPGDMVLFPSYLMHAVPPNQGERRITLSFNAIRTQLNSWDYVIRFRS